MREHEGHEWRERAAAPRDEMDVDRKSPADWPHWPDRGQAPRRRDRLESRLFRDSEREAEIELAQATVRRLALAAAEKEALVERLEHAVNGHAEPALALPTETIFLALVGTPSGYTLCAVEGDAPVPGDSVTIDGVEHIVAKVGRSPLPGDTRRCAYLDPS